MKVSARVEYGILAVMDLWLNRTKEPIQSSDIARRNKIPKPFLDQLLLELRKGGIVRSMRGPKGGYGLSKPASDITVYDIINILEGSKSEKFCPVMAAENGCPRNNDCALLNFWEKINQELMTRLKSATIEQICSEQEKLDKHVMYYI
ncbi:MAG: Rrf2 family transcriptional regulator [Deltaproteobacteria bacterium]|nr:Rrf2 family transcriptional regulator [Deltaproteobacteria bacterium]